MTSESWLDAEGVFETLRTYDNKPFALAEHLERLQRGIYELGIPAPSIEKIKDETHDHLESNRQESGHLRLVVDSLGKLSISHEPLAKFKDSLRVNLVEGEFSTGLPYKNTNYRSRLNLRIEAQNRGFDDSIICKGDEAVEAATCNIIFLRQGKWFTPSLRTGCLPGVTRQLLISHFGVEESSLTMKEIPGIEGIAVTSSLREIQRIQEVNGKVFPHSHLLERLQIEFHSWILGNLAL